VKCNSLSDDCIATNNLVMNLDKNNIMKYITHIRLNIALHIGYIEKFKLEKNTMFLGLQIHTQINWKNRFGQ